MLGLDQSNAFGLIDRMAVFNGCKELGLHFLLPVIRMLYDHDFTISFTSLDTEVKASTGLAQGSTFSSLFYCVGQWWLLKKFRDKHLLSGKAELFSFIDDNHLGVKDISDVKDAIMDFRDDMAVGGGKLNLTKLRILPGKGVGDNDMDVIIDALRELGLPALKARAAIVNGLMITGIPIGSDDFVKAACESQCDKVTRVLRWLCDTVQQTEHHDFHQTIVHRVFATIKHCVVSMSDFLLRAVDRDLCRDFAVRIDSAIAQSTLYILMCRIEDDYELVKTVHKIFLKSSCGGLGLRSMALMMDLSAVFSKLQALIVASQTSPRLLLTNRRTAHEPFGLASVSVVTAAAAAANGLSSSSSSSSSSAAASSSKGAAGSSASSSMNASGGGNPNGTGPTTNGKGNEGDTFLADTVGKRALFAQASNIRERRPPAGLLSQPTEAMLIDLGAVGTTSIAQCWALRGPAGGTNAAGLASRDNRQQSSVLGGGVGPVQGAGASLSFTTLITGADGEDGEQDVRLPPSSSSSSNNLSSSVAALFDVFPAGPQETVTIEASFFNWELFPSLLRHITTLCGSAEHPTALGRLDLNTFHRLSLKDINKLKKKCLDDLLRHQRACLGWMLSTGEEWTVHRSGCGSEAAAYLDLIPAPHRQRGRTDMAPPMDNELFIDSVRERLYLDRFSPPAGVHKTRWDCEACGMKEVMDCKGTHIGGCSKSAGYRQLRHDYLSGCVVVWGRILRDILAQGGKVSGETPFYKADLQLIGDPPGRHRLDWCFELRPSFPRKHEEMLMGDMTVTSPVAVLDCSAERFGEMMGPTTYDDNGRFLTGAGRPMGAAAALGVARKQKTYSRLLGSTQAEHVTCVSFEPYGMPSVEASKLCLGLAKRIVKANMDKREGLKADLQHRVAGGRVEEPQDEQPGATLVETGASALPPNPSAAASSASASSSSSSSSPSSSFSSQDNAATSNSAGNASSSANPAGNGSPSNNKTKSGKAGSMRLIKQMSVSSVFRRIITQLVTNLRRTHARIFTNYYSKYNLAGGNRWVTIKQGGDREAGSPSWEDGQLPA